MRLIYVFKMMFTHSPYDPAKTELLQTRSLKIQSKHKVHFQVDGEYLGKVNAQLQEFYTQGPQTNK